MIRQPPIRFVLYDANMTRRFRASGAADPVLDPAVIEAWLNENGQLVRSWTSHHLFRLVPPSAATPVENPGENKGTPKETP